MKKQMSPELRLLRKNCPLPISRLAYAKIYDKAVDVMSQIAASGIYGGGSVAQLFEMLSSSFSGVRQPSAAGCPALFCIYLCLRTEVEAARIRSEKARQRARSKAGAPVDVTPVESPVATSPALPCQQPKSSKPKVKRIKMKPVKRPKAPMWKKLARAGA